MTWGLIRSCWMRSRMFMKALIPKMTLVMLQKIWSWKVQTPNSIPLDKSQDLTLHAAAFVLPPSLLLIAWNVHQSSGFHPTCVIRVYLSWALKISKTASTKWHQPIQYGDFGSCIYQSISEYIRKCLNINLYMYIYKCLYVYTFMFTIIITIECQRLQPPTLPSFESTSLAEDQILKNMHKNSQLRRQKLVKYIPWLENQTREKAKHSRNGSSWRFT